MIELAAIALAWVSLSLLVGALADHWNRSGLAWFALAALLSPIFAVAWLAVMGDNRPTCPACRGPVHEGATACRHCGRDIRLPR